MANTLVGTSRATPVPARRFGEDAPNVAVVIVTWNRKDLVNRVLEELGQQTFPGTHLDVVVVENASTDGTPELLTQRWQPERVVENPTDRAEEPAFQLPAAGAPNRAGFRSLTLIRNKANLGGCGGFNTGFAFVEQVLDRAGPDHRPAYVWLIEDDVQLPADLCSRLVATARSDPNIGLVGSRVANTQDREETIETTIGFDPETAALAAEPGPRDPRHVEHRLWSALVCVHSSTGLWDGDVVSGCSMLARWSAVRRVGFWDKRYFLDWDAADWCLRFVRCGYRVVVNLDAVVYHAPRFQELTPTRSCYAQRNLTWMNQKALPDKRVKPVLRQQLWGLLWYALKACVMRRQQYADAARRAAADVCRGRGGKAEFDTPPLEDAGAALARIGALNAGGRVVFLCTEPGTLKTAARFREAVRAHAAQTGQVEPAWVEVVRDEILGKAERAALDRPDPDGKGSEDAPYLEPAVGVQRVLYNLGRKSRWLKQLKLWARRPSAVIVFDQTNDYPLLSGRFTLQVDRRTPGQCQVETESWLARLAFLLAWVGTWLLFRWYLLRLRPFASTDKYGGLPADVLARRRDSWRPVEDPRDRVVRPEDWPVADRPLRIVLFGWACLEAQAWHGSGYNLNASELATGLAMSGHEVFYLRSGMDYTRHPLGPFIRRDTTWRGVQCFSLVNSSNLSISWDNFRNTACEMSSPTDSKTVLAWLAGVRADVVHVHSLEGLPLDLIGSMRDAGYPVVVTPHNYSYACQAVELLYQRRTVCLDYEGGLKCASCGPDVSPEQERQRRALQQDRIHHRGARIWSAVQNAFEEIWRPLPERRLRLAVGDFTVPGSEAAHGFELKGPRAVDGTFEYGLWPLPWEGVPDLQSVPADVNQQVLEQARRPLPVLNDHGRRRAAGIEALNRASLVTPPSRFMCEYYQALGVRPAQLRQVRLGQLHFDQLHRRAKGSPYYTVRPWDPKTARRPLRVAFWGTDRPHKGFIVMARAIELLPRDVRQRCHFFLHVAGHDWPYRKLLSRFPEVSFLGGYDQLHQVGGAGEFDVGVLPFMWLENSPLVMLEYLHAGKFVLCSRLGGPVDWIHEPSTPGAEANGGLGNGLLFPGGDAQALADCLSKLVRGEVTIPSPSEVHAVSALWSYPQHVQEVEAIYREVAGQQVWAPAPAADRLPPEPTRSLRPPRWKADAA
jgi:GT2 family glycosyltransferase/glycosyltransferase involved in cell wall biosynthesis